MARIRAGTPLARYGSMTTAQPMIDLTETIIGAAIHVHETWGPGLLHSVYLLCLAHELLERSLAVEVEKPVPAAKGALHFDCAFRADLIVDERVIVEVKTVKHITDLDVAKLLTYLRLTDIRVGLIINFNINILKNGGIRRVVNRYVDHHGNLL
jgi:GxxExxY protein